MATVTLGSIKFKWKGTYSGATAYTVDDVVEYNGSSYICILASTGNLPTNATYFEQMSSAGTNGTNGTDLTSTLTTQGDLVYRDGSGLQRLGAGTAGQVLQTGGAGANPSWGTVSSDFVNLFSSTASGASSISIDNYFSSTYKSYKLVLAGVRTNIANASLAMRFNTATSTPDTNNNYYYAHDGVYKGSAQSGIDNNSAWSYGYFYLGNIVNTGTDSSSWDLMIYNATSSNHNTSISGSAVTWQTTPYLQQKSISCVWFGQQPAGFTLLDVGGATLSIDKINLYGLK